MGTLALDTDKVGPDIYSTLGLKESEKEAFESPRVLSLLSTLLERSVHINEVLLETAEIEDPVTVFHGLRAPTLSIRQYIERIFKYSGCSPSCFVVANIYVDRFLQRTDIHLTTLNVHRILITSVMVAAKFIDDAFFNNAYYARVGGVSTSELNILEMKFLFSIDFRLQVTVEKFGRYCSLLEKEAVEGLHIERLIQTNFSEHSLDEFLRRQIWMAAKLDGPSSHEVLLVDCPNPVQAREIRVVDELGTALRTSGNLPEGQRIWMVTTEGICSYKVL